MAFSWTYVGTTYKVNSINGVDTPGGDGTYGYQTIDYAIADVGAYPTGGAKFELVGTFTHTAPIDFGAWASPSTSGDNARCFIGKGLLTDGDGDRPVINSSGGIFGAVQSSQALLNLELNNTSASVGAVNIGSYCAIYNCKITDTAHTGWSVSMNTNARCYANEIVSTLGSGIDCSSFSHIAYNHVTAKFFGILVSNNWHLVANNHVVVSTTTAPNGYAIRGGLGDMVRVDRNVCVNTGTSEVGIDLYANQGHQATNNYIEGFVDYGIYSNGIIALAKNNISVSNGVDYSGPVNLAQNNVVWPCSGLNAGQLTDTLLATIPGIGPDPQCQGLDQIGCGSPWHYYENMRQGSY